MSLDGNLPQGAFLLRLTLMSTGAAMPFIEHGIDDAQRE
jgi:hypothetical protein